MGTQLGSVGPRLGSQFAPTTSETPMFCRFEYTGLPPLTALGPISFKSAGAGLPGNAVWSCTIPVGVGRTPGAEELGSPPVRCRSKVADPKNQTLSFLIGPPIVPPNLLSTYLGITGLSHVPPSGSCPRAQNGSP